MFTLSTLFFKGVFDFKFNLLYLLRNGCHGKQKKGFDEMKKPLSRLFCMVLSFGILFSFSCAPRFPDKSFIAEKPVFDLLIAVEPSEFKDQIISRLVDRYRIYGNIDLVGIKTLNNLLCEDYDAVLIMDSCEAWSWFNFTLKSFLKKSEHCSNVILFMTAGNPEWQYHYAGLDAITSASVVGEEDRVFDELSGKIDELLAGRNPD